MVFLRRCVAIVLVLAVAGQASAAVTPYLEPLQAQHQRLVRLRADMDAAYQARPWDAARAQTLGTEFLKEARAARRLIGQFCSAKGRKLATEFDEINASITVMGDSFMMYRTMKGAAAPVASAADEDSVRSEWNTFLRDYGRMKFDEHFGVEGLAEILTAGSFKDVVDVAWEKARPKLQEEVGREMERLTGLRFYDRRSLSAAMKTYARRQVEKGVAKLLIKITSNELIIEWAAGILIRWIGPKLKEALRQKGNLDERTRISLGTLESARRSLNALPGTSDLSVVSREVRRAQATIAATKYLQRDLTRARRVDLSDRLGYAMGRLETTLDLTAIRFPARDCAEEIPDVDEALAKLDRELQRLIAMPLAPQPGGQVIAATPAATPAGAASPAPRATMMPTQAAALEDDLVGSWSFGRENGPALCTLQLTKTAGAHGFVIRSCNPNESFWRMEGPDTVVFLHSDGTITSRLTRVNKDYWKGPYIPNAQVPLQGITHYIRRASTAYTPPAGAAAPSAAATAAPSVAATGSRDWVVYINMEEFTCCRYDPGWRDRYPNFQPDEAPRTLSITFVSSAQKDPKKRIVSQPFKTHAEAKAWLCGSHKVVRYGGGTIARVAGIIVVLGGICPANSTE